MCFVKYDEALKVFAIVSLLDIVSKTASVKGVTRRYECITVFFCRIYSWECV